MASPIFCINSPQVVQETIDGEVVIINLLKGHYYSLRGTGAFIWTQIDQQLNQELITQQVLQHYSGEAETIVPSLQSFFDQLQAEELVVISTESNFEEHNNNLDGLEKLPFELPKLEKFTDMEELLLLDPLHEVDESGWPNAKNLAEV